MTEQRQAILELVANCGLPVHEIAAGDKLFLKGDAAGCMYVVMSGTVEVLMYGRILERVGKGGIVGEMALIDGNARCAAALTGEATKLIAIDRAAFLDLVRREPQFALAVLDVMARRLRAMNARVADAL
ncbi:MAG: Crp/Fnr family transcriptional regulator [Hyphomicrobiaceae bacterium]|nr:Crp/Fnr family transcriptional regulator [Hyphomicrobiaceae bacterium]